MEGYSRDDPQSAGGEIMILHTDGRIQISNVFDDLFLYRMYTYADEKEAAEKASQNQMGGGAGGYGGGGDYYGGGGDAG